MNIPIDRYRIAQLLIIVGTLVLILVLVGAVLRLSSAYGSRSDIAQLQQPRPPTTTLHNHYDTKPLVEDIKDTLNKSNTNTNLTKLFPGAGGGSNSDVLEDNGKE